MKDVAAQKERKNVGPGFSPAIIEIRRLCMRLRSSVILLAAMLMTASSHPNAGAALGAPEAGAAVNAPVANAARTGDRETVKSLLKDGADVNAPEGDGMTALHWAAERGDAELAATLIYAGANIGAQTRIGQYTPLHIAAKGG